VHLGFYRAQLDLFFDGTVVGTAAAPAPVAWKPFPYELCKDFSVILTPEMRSRARSSSPREI